MRASNLVLVPKALALTFLFLLVTPIVSAADKGGDSASAIFGRGLNTAQPGNAVNHAVLPNKLTVKAGGVVNFTVAGFHDIIIFKPGFTMSDLVNAGGGQLPVFQTFFVLPPDPAAPLPAELEFLAEHIYYRGINPAGGPAGTAATSNPANDSNRAEIIAFFEKGTYLVICNIRPHLVDGMLAEVHVN